MNTDSHLPQNDAIPDHDVEAKKILEESETSDPTEIAKSLQNLGYGVELEMRNLLVSPEEKSVKADMILMANRDVPRMTSNDKGYVANVGHHRWNKRELQSEQYKDVLFAAKAECNAMHEKGKRFYEVFNSVDQKRLRKLEQKPKLLRAISGKVETWSQSLFAVGPEAKRTALVSRAGSTMVAADDMLNGIAKLLFRRENGSAPRGGDF